MFLYLSGCVCCNPKVVSFNLPNDSWTRLHHLHHAPFTSAQNFLLFLFVWWWFGEGDLNTKDDYNPMWKWFVHLTVNTHLNIWGADFLAIKATHSFDGAITIFKMYKGIVFNLLYSFHFAILLKLFLHKYVYYIYVTYQYRRFTFSPLVFPLLRLESNFERTALSPLTLFVHPAPPVDRPNRL